MGWAQGLLLLLTTVSAAIIPNVAGPNDLEKVSSDAGSAGDIGQYTLSYLVHCYQCPYNLRTPQIQIDLKVLPSTQECGSQNTVFLNNYALPDTDWHDPISSDIVFEANRSDTSAADPVQVKAFVQLKCIDGHTSLLSVTVNSFDEYSAPSQAGFTVSFRQQDRVQRVLQKDVPLRNIQNPKLDREWGGREWSEQLLNMAREYRELQRLEADLRQKRSKHYKQQQYVKAMIVDEFKSCERLSCYLEAAKERAPYLRSLIKTLFQEPGRHYNSMTTSEQVLFLADDVEEYTTAQYETPETDYYYPEDNPYSRPLSTSPSSTRYHPSTWSIGIDFSTAQYTQPSFARRHRLPIILSSVLTIVLLVIALLIKKLIKVKISCAVNPQWKRDCAARREERRTKAAYRRAACRQKVKQWWYSFRTPKSTSDYEEKRERILNQECVLESAMQAEITCIQRAHLMASDMVQAEEGRQRLYHEANFGSQLPPLYSFAIPTPTLVGPRENNEEGSGSVGSGRTLPLYLSPPPSYQSDLVGDMTVVEGFDYTPSNSDVTSESSVVDCSSRISFDTDSIGQPE